MQDIIGQMFYGKTPCVDVPLRGIMVDGIKPTEVIRYQVLP